MNLRCDALETDDGEDETSDVSTSTSTAAALFSDASALTADADSSTSEFVSDGAIVLVVGLRVDVVVVVVVVGTSHGGVLSMTNCAFSGDTVSNDQISSVFESEASVGGSVGEYVGGYVGGSVG